MMRTQRRPALQGRAIAALAVLLPALAGCGGAVIPQVAPPAVGFKPASKPQSVAVIGADARGLLRLFGEPRLDIRDPAARKLQFANQQCILDAYLYAPAAGREPVVTHVDARTSAGAEMDWQACVRLLRAK